MSEPEKYQNGGITHGPRPDDDSIPVILDNSYTIPRSVLKSGLSGRNLLKRLNDEPGGDEQLE